MSKLQITEQGYAELLKSRYPDQAFIDDVLACLHRAGGIAGFVAEAVCPEPSAGSYREINAECLWRTAEAIELEIKDAIVMIDNYYHQLLDLTAEEMVSHCQNNVKKRTFSEAMAEESCHGE